MRATGTWNIPTFSDENPPATLFVPDGIGKNPANNHGLSLLVFCQLDCQLFLGKLRGTCLAALETSSASQFYSCCVPIILKLIFYLTSGNIDNQLAELNRVAWALETTGCHYTWISLIRGSGSL
jgi:hypothetical protein